MYSNIQHISQYATSITALPHSGQKGHHAFRFLKRLDLRNKTWSIMALTYNVQSYSIKNSSYFFCKECVLLDTFYLAGLL